MKNQVLTIDQCKELVALGLNMNDASMCWMSYTSPITKNFEKELCINNVSKRYFYISRDIKEDIVTEIPTYTLQDILEKIPSYIKELHYTLSFDDNKIGYGIYSYGEFSGWAFNLYPKPEDTIIDSAFRLLKWCLIKNYIK